MKEIDFGKFIAKLRTEKNLTQEELGEKAGVSREAVNKWEKDVNKPNGINLKRLSVALDISIDELLLGKRISKENINEVEDLKINLYDSKNKYKRRFKNTMILLVLILILFLVYYFLNTYNTIMVYNINYNDKNVDVKNGIFVTTKEKIYFNLSNIVCASEITNLKLYYKNNNEDMLVYESDDNKIIIYDFYGYNEYFPYNEIKAIVKNLYLDITTSTDKYTIKLDLKKDFANNKFFNLKKQNIKDKEKDNQNKQTETKIDIEKIKNQFKLVDGTYIYENNNKIFSFFEEASLLNLTENNQEWNYYIDKNVIEYNEYLDNEIIKSFLVINSEVKCNTGNCVAYKDSINYFYDSVQKILK